MNMHLTITTDPSPTAANLNAAYRARRAREAQKATKSHAANENAPAEQSERNTAPPMWKTHRLTFRSHVNRHEWFVARPIAAFICRRAYELGSSYEALTPRGRASFAIIAIRDRIAAEYKAAHPEVKWTELARAFGRDHSAIFYGVHRIWANEGNEESRRKLDARDQRLRDHYFQRKARGER